MTSPAPFRPSPPGAKIALVVDDDPTIRTLVAATLSQSFSVYIAESAQRAMQMLLEIPTPQLLVCDVAMPAVDGIQFVKKIRTLHSLANTPIIFLTAKAMPMDVVAGNQRRRALLSHEALQPGGPAREGAQGRGEVTRRRSRYFTGGGTGGGGSGDAVTGVTHEDKSKRMNSIASSSGVSFACWQPVGVTPE